LKWKNGIWFRLTSTGSKLLLKRATVASASIGESMAKPAPVLIALNDILNNAKVDRSRRSCEERQKANLWEKIGMCGGGFVFRCREAKVWWERRIEIYDARKRQIFETLRLPFSENLSIL
jgi:hypothetical protein